MATFCGPADSPRARRYTVAAMPSASTLNTSPTTTWLARTVTYIQASKRLKTMPVSIAASRLIQTMPVT